MIYKSNEGGKMRDANFFELLIGFVVVMIMFIIVVAVVIGCVVIKRGDIYPEDAAKVSHPVYVTPEMPRRIGIDTSDEIYWMRW